jgi:hypothetical protein
MKISPKYTWGDQVKVVSTADKKFRPNERGVVCTIDEPIENVHESYRYTVEYPDGSSCLIPEELLEPYSKSRP